MSFAKCLVRIPILLSSRMNQSSVPREAWGPLLRLARLGCGSTLTQRQDALVEEVADGEDARVLGACEMLEHSPRCFYGLDDLVEFIPALLVRGCHLSRVAVGCVDQR